ncbi:MAG: Mur ligase family protein, partial [Flavobacteriaceae bacterium]
FASKFTTATLIGITGTNGKTTTALMTYHILKNAGYEVALAGNIGNSFAKEVAENDCQYYVLEISSFQLDDIVNFAPHIGVITNITPDHLDRYNNDFGQYLESKLRINKNQSERDVLL